MSNINSNNPNESNDTNPPLLTPAYRLFLHKLVEVRETAGLSTAELATKLDVPEAEVSSGESGQHPLDFLEVRAWLRALDVNLTDFTEQLDALITETLESRKADIEEVK